MTTKLRRQFTLFLFMFIIIITSTLLIFNCNAQASLANNGNGTVTDSRTGLIWRQGEPGGMTWGNALTDCEGLSLGGA